MEFTESFKNQLFQVNEQNFESYALKLFEYQYNHNPTYQAFARLIDKTPNRVETIEEIPFLPIEFWKSHEVKTKTWKEEKYFLSSGTGNEGRSKAYLKSSSFYNRISKSVFERLFGPLRDLQIIALLPSYQDNPHSSLIHMVDYFMQCTDKPSQYYQINDHQEIKEFLEDPTSKKLVIGVSYALLDLIEKSAISARNTIIMETGGMKGRRREMIRTELHQLLQKGFHVSQIFSEYGMSELMSQAYTQEKDRFRAPDWMRILIRDVNDPLQLLPIGKTGGINIIDLANIDTCAFLETKDLGKIHLDGTFEVLGRFDNSEIRGCNLLIA